MVKTGSEALYCRWHSKGLNNDLLPTINNNTLTLFLKDSQVSGNKIEGPAYCGLVPAAAAHIS